MENNTARKTHWLILATITILVVTTFVLVGCSFFNKDEPIEDQLPEDIVSEIEDIETQVQGSLQDVLNAAMSGDAESNELLSETEYRNGFKVLSYSETETGVLVTLLVYSPDLYTVAKEIDENYVFETEEELEAAVIEAVGKAEIIEQEIEVEFIKAGDGYEPVLTMEFFDAYFGGAFKLLDDALAEMNEEATE